MSNQDMEYVMTPTPVRPTFRYIATDVATGKSTVRHEQADTWIDFINLMLLWNDRMAGRMTYKFELE